LSYYGLSVILRMLILCKPTSATAVTVLPESVYKSRWCFLRTGCLSKIHCLPLRCHSLELLWSVGYTTYADTPGSHPGQDPSQTFENTYWHNISDTLHLVAYADWSGDSDVSICWYASQLTSLTSALITSNQVNIECTGHQGYPECCAACMS